MKKHSLGILLGLSLTLLTCTLPRQISKSYNEAKIQLFYGNSIADTAKPESEEISANLVSINNQNSALHWKNYEGEDYVLVSTWTRDTTFYNTRPQGSIQFNTGIGEIWVTVVPELKNLCREKKFGRKEGLDLRLKQLIGLPPTTTKTHFVELWVKPGDLFRPCPDNEIEDNQCDLCFSENADSLYTQWFNNLRTNSYYNCNPYYNYPWTQLGYTYDWNPKNKSHQGLSEFIIRQHSDVLVNGVFSTAAYCGLSE